MAAPGPVAGFLHATIDNEGDEILAYCFPPGDPALSAMKGVLHTCEDFGRKYSESDVDSVTFTVGGFAGWGYVARFQAFADVLFVLLLPCRNSWPDAAQRGVFRETVALLRFTQSAVGDLVRDPGRHATLDAVFRQLFARSAAPPTPDGRRGLLHCLPDAVPAPHLPPTVLEPIGLLLAEMEASEPLFPPFPSGTHAALSLDPTAGTPLYAVVGSMVLHRGQVLQSTARPDHTLDVGRFLHFTGVSDRREGDGELLLIEDVFIVDHDLSALDFIMDATTEVGVSPPQSPPGACSPQRVAALLAVVSRDTLTVACLLRRCDVPTLGRAAPDWVEVMRICACRLKAEALPGITSLEARPWPPLRTDDAASEAAALSRTKSGRLVPPDPTSAPSITEGPYNVLLHFTLYSPTACHVILPASATLAPHPPSVALANPPAPTLLLLRHLRHTFAEVAVHIRAVLDAFDDAGPSPPPPEASPGPAQEYGIHVVERSEAGSPLFGYWVVGVRLPTGAECFVCYEDSIPQCASDLALRLLFDTA